MIRIKGTPLPQELEELGIQGILLQDGIQVTADTPEKTLARCKAIAFYLCNHPSKRISYNNPISKLEEETIIGGRVCWNHFDDGEPMETPIGEWARHFLNPEPTSKQLEDTEAIWGDREIAESMIIDWIIDPFNLIKITSPPQT